MCCAGWVGGWAAVLRYRCLTATAHNKQQHAPAEQVPQALLLPLPQLRTTYIDVPRTECESNVNDQTSISFDQVAGES